VNKNFTFIFSHKYKKTPAMLSRLYIENKNRKNKFTTTPKSKARFTLRLKEDTPAPQRTLLVMKSGNIVTLYVIKAFTMLADINRPVMELYYSSDTTQSGDPGLIGIFYHKLKNSAMGRANLPAAATSIFS
jgi:hypothetical protein